METNVCYACRFGSVKIEILVPEKYNLKTFAEQTRKFAADIATATQSKPIHYKLRFDSASNISNLGFNVHCTCILNVAKNDCSNFNTAASRVKHLKSDKPQGDERKLEPIKIL